MKALISILVFVQSVVMATIIPTGRVPSSGTFEGAGVEGGIPQRTTVYTSLTSAATAAQIDTAINACPSNQVVFLAAGTYTINAPIRPGWPNGQGVTLRGAGTNTILNFADGAFIQTIPSDFFDYTDTNRIRSWTAGFSQGTTVIQIDHPGTTPYSHQDIQVGTTLFLSQDNDPNVGVTSIVPIVAGGANTNDSGQPFGGSRLQVQQVTVTAIDASGTNITISPPLGMTNWRSALNPVVWWFGQPEAGFGIENLAINAVSDSYNPIQISYARNCYISNVVSIKAVQANFDIAHSVHCEIRHSTARESQGYGAGSYGFVVGDSGSCLIVDCISDVVTAGVLVNASSFGNVIAYNYITPNSIYLSSGNNFYPETMGTHEPHPTMNLFEGNYCGEIELDFTHGSASHQTLFRNRIYGGPDRVTQTANTFPLNIQASNRFVNIVGNLLGNSAWHTNAYQLDETTAPGSAKTIYRLDFVDDSGATNYFDAQVAATLLRHGNYDTVNGAIVWDAGIADHSPANSMYLASKPSWFGSAPWPPYDSASPSSNSYTNIPAGYRFLNGSDPSSGGSGGSTSTGGIATGKPQFKGKARIK